MAKPPTSPEFDRFTSVVDQVLSVRKTEKPQSEEKKDRVLPYLRSELEREERQKSQVSEAEPPKLSEERRLQDLRYLREEIEAEERRKSQVVPKQSS